jgi:hypothetical protein
MCEVYSTRTYVFLSNLLAWPFGTLIIFVAIVSVKLGTGALSRTENGPGCCI